LIETLIVKPFWGWEQGLSERERRREDGSSVVVARTFVAGVSRQLTDIGEAKNL
jgi:hypothetical protein